MDVRDLRCSAASVSAGNFGRAAKSLAAESSTISRRVGRVEEELGLELFEWTRTGVHLTAGGQTLMVRVRRANRGAADRRMYDTLEQYLQQGAGRKTGMEVRGSFRGALAE